MIKRTYLYLLAAAIWGIPGIRIAFKGIMGYQQISHNDLWWLILVTVAVNVFFFIVFSKVVRKYSERISSLPEKVTIWDTFPVSGWILLSFMMGIGIVINFIPDVPLSFVASFYSGLGPMLVVAALRFVAAMVRKRLTYK